MGRARREPPVGAARAARGGDVCPHAPDCVGCPLVGTRYPEQLRVKHESLRAALHARPELRAVEPEAPFGSPRAFGYRNQAKLVFRRRRVGAAGSEVLLGVYRPGTHSVAPAHACAVHHPQLHPILAALRAQVERLAIPIFDERSRSGALRYALARTSLWSGESQLTLVSAVDPLPRLAELGAGLRRAAPRLRALAVCLNPTPGNALLSPDIRPLFGPPTLVERFGDLGLEFRPDAFLQANPPVAAKIYATAVRWLAPTAAETAVDLFCGVGAIALTLAPRLGRVVGIESSAAAIACARANAARARAANVEFVHGDASDVARLLAAERLPRPDIAVVNPPRRGLGPETARAISRLGVSRLAYVSCDPASLARDIGVLAAERFRLRRVRAFDMLPQTPHVEALALLAREAG